MTAILEIIVYQQAVNMLLAVSQNNSNPNISRVSVYCIVIPIKDDTVAENWAKN